MAGSPQSHFENRYVRKDGRVVHIMWSANWSEADRLRIAVARDITERKRAEQLKNALYAISEAAHAVDSQGDLYRQIHQIIGELLPIGRRRLRCRLWNTIRCSPRSSARGRPG